MVLIFINGIKVLGDNIWGILILITSCLGVGLWMARLMPGEWRKQAWLLFPFSLIAGIFPLALFSLFFALTAWLWPPILVIGFIGYGVLGFGGLVTWFILEGKKIQLGIPKWAFLLGSICLFFLLVVRLAFLKDLLLPPYSDGVEHFLMVRDLLSPAIAPQGSHALPEIFERYYHFGFHGIAAWLAVVSCESPEHAIILFGQILQVISPLAVLFLVGASTSNRSAAFFAALLAGIGFKMPAFASNWAKYPTISGIVLFPVALGAIYLVWKYGKNKPLTWVLAALLSGGMVVFHSRTLMCLVLAALCFLISLFFDRFIPRKVIPWITFLVGFFAGYILISQWYLMQFYCSGSCYTLIGIAIFTPLAILYTPSLVLGIFLFLLGMVGMSILHLPHGLLTYSATWIDGPFLGVATYQPLVVLGGLGIAGLLSSGEALIRKVGWVRWKWIGNTLTTLLVVLVFWIFSKIDTFKPNSCCNYIHVSDINAFKWIENNIPLEAVIIISGYPVGETLISMDGGMWITALTGRQTRIEGNSYNWDSLEKLRAVCETGDVYVYYGGEYYSFEDTRFLRADWYKPVFEENRVRIYHVTTCIGKK
jgi:hypothetical protein